MRMAERKAEIARIRSVWAEDPRLEAGYRRISELQEKILAEEMFLLKARNPS